MNAKEEEARRWLARQLRMDDVPEVLWADLVEYGFVKDAVDAEGENYLLNEARRLLRFASQYSEQGYRPVNIRAPLLQQSQICQVDQNWLTEDELLRTVALSMHLAKGAAGLLPVRQFRADILGGRVLTEQEANEFVASPAARFFSPQNFRRWSIPFVGHSASIVEGEDTTEVSVFCDPPGNVFSKARLGAEEAILLKYPGLNVSLWPGSVLDELSQITQELLTYFRWRRDAADTVARFILTDLPPLVEPVAIYAGSLTPLPSRQDKTITMDILPWVSGETVLRFYKAAQRILLNHNRYPAEARNIMVFAHVMEQTTCERRPPWRELMVSWNKEYPHWEYRDLRIFCRDYARGKRAVFPLAVPSPKRREKVHGPPWPWDVPPRQQDG